MYDKFSLFIILICLIKSIKLESCDADNTYPYTGVKTPYSDIYNDTINSTNLSNCKPLQIWLLHRHGTRFPNERRILQMLNMTHVRDLIIDNHENGNRGHLCDNELKALKNWKSDPKLDPKKGKYLSTQGKRELTMIGYRFRIKFPELFNGNPFEDYKFRSTNTSRTIKSMKYFIKGSFNDECAVKMEIMPITNDTLLKIYENCESWKKERFNKEVEAFIDGPEVAKVVAKVTQRLGFANNLTNDEVFLIYDMCRFERAWYPDKESPWCAAFTNEDMHMFEYEEDLYHYYSVGPGREINKRLGCQPLRDMFDRFTKLENGENSNEPKGVFYFTHSEMIMLFYSALELAKDSVPLTASNYRQMDHRNWRTSLLVPFAVNFAAVFYSCESENDSPFKVAFYLAENPLTLDGCSDGICDWAQLKKNLAAIVANCSPKVCQKIP